MKEASQRPPLISVRRNQWREVHLAIGYHILTTILSGTKNRLLYLYAEAGLNEGISICGINIFESGIN